MKLMSAGAVVALMMSGAVAAQTPAAVKAAGDEKVTLTGCVVKGEGGYVLMHEEKDAPPATAAPAPGTVGTSGVPSAASAAAATSAAGRVFYWLDDDDDLEEHAGQRVEVVGKLEGEIEKGDMAVERENGLVEIEFKVDGDRKVTIKVPELPAAVGTSGAVTDREQDYNFRVRRVDVESVKMLASTCR